jgi:hypothetical protein
MLPALHSAAPLASRSRTYWRPAVHDPLQSVACPGVVRLLPKQRGRLTDALCAQSQHHRFEPRSHYRRASGSLLREPIQIATAEATLRFPPVDRTDRFLNAPRTRPVRHARNTAPWGASSRFTKAASRFHIRSKRCVRGGSRCSLPRLWRSLTRSILQALPGVSIVAPTGLVAILFQRFQLSVFFRATGFSIRFLLLFLRLLGCYLARSDSGLCHR